MKYIKKLNIDFDNWDETIKNKYNIGDRVLVINNNNDLFYINRRSTNCNNVNYITKNDSFYINSTQMKDDELLIIEKICTIKDITYLKFKYYWPWFFADDFKIAE